MSPDLTKESKMTTNVSVTSNTVSERNRAMKIIVDLSTET